MNTFLNMTIKDSGIWMDGGTMTIEAELLNGSKVTIEFVQKSILEVTSDGKYAGQLYLNNQHVSPRSNLEKEIIEGLKELLYRKGGIPWIEKPFLADNISYLESDQYISDLNKQIEA